MGKYVQKYSTAGDDTLFSSNSLLKIYLQQVCWRFDRDEEPL